MLGITTPDAIALGMLLIAAVAMLKGSKQGDAAKAEAIKAAPLVSIAGSIVEASQFGDWIKAVDKLAIAIAGHTAALNRQHDVKFTNALEELAEKVDEALEARPKPRSSR